jgi:hypothetical protein
MLNSASSTEYKGGYGPRWLIAPSGIQTTTLCTCVDQSVLLWKAISGENMGFMITPDQITEWIINKNSSDTGYANNGNTLQ